MGLRTRLVHQSQYIALRTAAALVHCFSKDQNLQMAASIGTLFHRLNRKRCERSEGNIRRSFPDWPEHRVKEVAEKSLQHMFQIFLVDTLVTPRLITPETWPSYVEIGNVEAMLGHFVRGKSAIVVTGHCGNWELAGHMLAVLGYPCVALARPIDNPLVNQYLLKVREARGTRIVTKWGATPILQETLASGGRVGFIADQNAGTRGMFVPFFGRLASSYKSIGLLAMRYRVPIIVAGVMRIGEQFRFRVYCEDSFGPEDWDAQPDPLFYITARFNRGLENMIRKHPEQYLWLHRRWKSRPRHEREDKSFPSSLVAKLEGLPWMTQDLLNELMKPL